MKKTLALTFLFAALLALPVGAQTPATSNPNTVTFEASADHAALSLDGQPMVTKYEMRVFLEAGGAVLFTTTLGKPTPVADLISITNAIWFAGLTPKTRYIAKIAALGPTGEGISEASNPFGLAGTPAAPKSVTLSKK